jgi:hypothetical protein
MAMVCPQCGKIYEQRLDCQLCGVRLVFYDFRRRAGRLAGPVVGWRQTPLGRIIIGVFLAQGLFWALRQLFMGAFGAYQPDASPQDLWATPSGPLLLQGVCLGALLVGAVLAGSSQRAGLVLGAVVGVWNGVLWSLLRLGPRQGLAPVEIIAQPILQAAVGMLGGWVGSLIWRPVPEFDPLAQMKRKRRFAETRSLFAGPINWFWVVLGILVAVGGTLWAARLFDMAMDAVDGLLGTADDLQDRLLIWEIRALALFAGGVVAGANCRNGFKQGVVVGLGTAVLLIGMQMARYEIWWQVAPWTLLSSLTLPVAGGSFGGRLLPPVVRMSRKPATEPAL